MEEPESAIASITKLETLGYNKISSEEQRLLTKVFATCLSYPLDDEIIGRAIELRQQKWMSLADSIIAATALEYGLSLVTRNEADFTHIPDLNVINPFNGQ